MSWFFFLAVLFVTLPPFFRCFRFPPAFPTQHSPSIVLAVAVFGVEQFGTILWLAPFSRLGSYVLYWIMTSDSHSSYSGKDMLLYSSVSDFWVEHTARSCSFTQNLSISEFRCGCLYVFHFVGLRLFQLRVRSAKWADSPRASSQVNGLSSLEFKTRSGLTVRVHLRRSTAGPARITIFLHFRNH